MQNTALINVCYMLVSNLCLYTIAKIVKSYGCLYWGHLYNKANLIIFGMYKISKLKAFKTLYLSYGQLNSPYINF